MDRPSGHNPRMTYFSRDEFSASSEEYFPDSRPGSLLFSQSSEVDHWCQSISFPAGFPLTPPDTASDCAPSDCSEMNSQSWSTPDDGWPNTFASDTTAWIAAADGEWQPQKSPIVNSDSHTMDPGAWLGPFYGSVGTGLSPTLSHESQTSHTLSSLANPDVSLLPRSLDLSFVSVSAADSTWASSLPVTCQSLDVVQQDVFHGMMGPGPLPADGLPAFSAYYTVPGGPATEASPQQSTRSSQSHLGQTSRRTNSEASTANPRPLLPRTSAQQSSFDAVIPSRPCRALKPRTASAGYADNVTSVSDASGPSQDYSRGLGHPRGLATSVTTANGLHTARTAAGSATEGPFIGRPTTLNHMNQDTSSLDIDSFIEYDQEDQPPVKGMSFPSEHPLATGFSTGKLHAHADASEAKLNAEGPAWTVLPGSTGNHVVVTSNDADEGRHRNHPLYSKGPHSDGFYHCPWENQQNCQHKPAKLKCAYDKFIDSHLKPFRCKLESCSKQEFSSTACLLRHEREAHGMHGHGDRPHLCYYTGCERAVPGNGFPRKYNLHDHMKRVHDYKEEPAQDNPGYPDGSGRGLRKGGGRKRKSVALTVEEPVAQRQKTLGRDQRALSFPPPQWTT